MEAQNEHTEKEYGVKLFADFCEANKLSPEQIYLIHLESKLDRIGDDIMKLTRRINYDNQGEFANVDLSFKDQADLKRREMEYPIVFGRFLELSEEAGTRFTQKDFEIYQSKKGGELNLGEIERASGIVYSDTVASSNN